jgi:integrase
MARPRSSSVRKETLGDGSIVYWANLTVAVGDRRRVTLGYSREGTSEAQARDELRRQEALVVLGKWQDPRPAEPTGGERLFEPFTNEVYAAKKRELSDEGRYMRWALELHLLPFFGDYPLRAIDIELIERYKQAKLTEAEEIEERIAAGEPARDERGRAIRPLSHSSINKTLEVLASVLRRAVKLKLIPENPAADEDVKLRARKPRRTWCMPDQMLDLIEATARIDQPHRPQTREAVEWVQRLRRETPMTLKQIAAELELSLSTVTHYAGLRLASPRPSIRRAIVTTLALAGLRASELCELRWRDIDFTNRQINVRGTKSDAAQRSVKIVDFLRDELLRWKRAAPATGPNDLVFPSATGKKRTKDNIRARVVLAALREANRMRQLRDLPVIDEGISTHTLRRTYTAMMLAHGNPPKSVQEEAGHADERTTLRIYAQAINTDFKPTKRILTVLCAYTDEAHHDYPDCRQDRDGHLGRRAMSATITLQAGLVERGHAVLPGGHTSTSTIARPRHGSLSDA